MKMRAVPVVSLENAPLVGVAGKGIVVAEVAVGRTLGTDVLLGAAV